MNTKIIAILMASVVAMAIGVPMAMSTGTPTTSATVGNVAPEVTDVTVTPSSVTMKPCREGDTPIKVEATVTDANGDVPNNMTVKITKIMNSSSGDASGYINNTGGLPVSMAYNVSTTNYEATLNLTCCMPADDYTVTINATDDGGLWDTNTSTFKVNPGKALSLNFDKVAFGPAAPGTDNVAGNASLGGTPEANPGVKSEGNDPIDIGVLADDLEKGTDKIGGEKMEANIKALGWNVVKPEHTFDTKLGCLDTASAAFQLDIPSGTPEGTYTGNLTISAK